MSGVGAGGRGDIDIEGDDVSPLHYIEDIELQYTEVPHLRCSDRTDSVDVYVLCKHKMVPTNLIFYFPFPVSI